MLSLIKRLFSSSNEKSSSSLMDRAMEQVINSGGGQTFRFTKDSSTLFSHVDDDYDVQLLQEQAIEQHQQFVEQHQRDVDLFNQQNQMQQDFDRMNEMHDPFLNPGQDIVVDEHHHLDHGFDDGGHHDY